MFSTPPLIVGRSLLRTRLLGWCLLALFVSGGGGISLAAAGAARRTDTVLSRFLGHAGAADVTVDLPADSTKSISTIEHFPGVRSGHVSAGLFAFRLLDGNRADLTGIDQVLASVDGRFLTSERPAVAAGRLPDPQRADEAFITAATAQRTGLHIGSVVRLVMLDATHPPANPTAASAIAQARQATVHVVGIATMTDEVVQDDIARDYRIVVTPAFFRQYRASTSFMRLALRLDGGEGGVAAIERRISRAAGGSVPFEDEHDIAARTQRGIRPTALVLALFAILAALVTALVIGQAIARQMRAGAGDLGTLRALGFDGRQLMQAVALAPAITVAAGAVGAIGVAVALSPLGPVGVGRAVEPNPGVAVDALVLFVGSAALFVVLAMRVGVSVVRSVHRAQRPDGRASITARTRLTPYANRLGPVAAVGVGMATGASAFGTTVRASASAIIAALLLLTMAVTFGAGLHELLVQPRLYGWNWDSAVQLSGGYGLVERGPDGTGAITPSALRAVPGVAAASSVRYEKLDVDGASVSAIGVRPFVGRVDLAMAAGRPPEGDNEVVLGQSTADHVHARIGSRVTVAYGATSHRAVVVGIAVFPSLGQVDAERTGLGEGIEMSGIGLARLVPLDPYDPLGAKDRDGRGSDNGLIIRYRPGADDAAVTSALRRRFGEAPEDSRVVGPQRAAELVDYRKLGRAPAILVALLALAAVGTLAQSITTSVRDHRRDMGLLKTLGFTRRQVANTVAWQASTVVLASIVVGVPLGVVAGRQLWSLYARQVGVLAHPVTPTGLLAVVAVSALVLANLVARIPAWAAARLPAGEVLHAE